ncbi:MAG: hypothetical protein R3199_06815, partial [Gemmatimonadota bacterium]|nr:hypothetical protein [Gemmatimonadota bacterium]
AGLHSTETGSPEMVMELAYRLAVSEREEIREIRDGLVVLITPVVEPERGGTLVAIADGGRLVVDGGIVRHVGRGGGEEVRTPGSELRAKVLRPDHPLAYGYEEETSVFRGNDPIWTIGERYRDRVVVQLGTKEVEDWDARDARLDRGEAADPTGEARPDDFGIETGRDGDEPDEGDEEAGGLVLSGGIEGAEEVDGEPAILDLPVGEGRVVLFSFNPLHRYLNLSDFRFATNAILHWDDMPAAE